MIVAESNVILVGGLSLPAEPVRVGQARRHVAAAIRDWKVSVDADTAVLLTSEVFTNAILHGGAAGGGGDEDGDDDGNGAGHGEIRLVESWDGERFRIEVHDSRPAGPDLGDRPLDAVTGESGRGLGMVGLLADHWGVERTAEGKQVYFVLESIGARSAETIRAVGSANTNGSAGANGTAGTAALCCLLGDLSTLALAPNSADTPGAAGVCSQNSPRPMRKTC